MSVTTRLVRHLLSLPPARSPAVEVERDLAAIMPDGTRLLADRWYPRGAERLPTILIRSPYGRRAWLGLLGRLFAESGYNVVLQSCRGTFGSTGQFDPLRHESEDGAATVNWIAEASWFDGRLGTWGPSYLGYVQWALAPTAEPFLKAMAVQIAASDFRPMTYPGGSYGLDTLLTWTYLVHHQERSIARRAAAVIAARGRLRRAYGRLPLAGLDRQVCQREVPFWQDWLTHDQPGDPWWTAVDHSGVVPAVTAPVQLIGGWYDIFLPSMLADYAALHAAGRAPQLLIGPWQHVNMSALKVEISASLEWFDEHLAGVKGVRPKATVRVFVMGSGEWVDLLEWPPSNARPQAWYLHDRGRLSQDPASTSAPDRYCYDPSDPTPVHGGASLSRNSGPRGNRATEARKDVVAFTSEPLLEDLVTIGEVTVELFAASDLSYTDFFVRLCDVDRGGRSVNLSDGLLRLRPGEPDRLADGTLQLSIRLWPTAYRFAAGHRVRLQVSSGAHPLYARNGGDGAPLATSIGLERAQQAIHHDPDHPSRLILPVIAGGRSREPGD